MWTYSYLKDTRDPFLFGSIIRQRVACGKPNCKCVLKNEKHEAYYLKWREKDLFTNISKLRKKYLKKSEIEQVRAELYTQKGRYILGKLNPSQIDFVMEKIPKGSHPDIYAMVAYGYFKKAPFPIVEESQLAKEISELNQRMAGLKMGTGKKNRAEYLRHWRWDKKRQQLGLR